MQPEKSAHERPVEDPEHQVPSKIQRIGDLSNEPFKENSEFWAPLLGWWNHVPPYAIPYGSQVHRLFVRGRITKSEEVDGRLGLLFPVYGEEVVWKPRIYLERHAVWGMLPEGMEELTADMVQQYEQAEDEDSASTLTLKGALSESDEIALRQLGLDQLTGSRLEVLWDTQDDETGKTDYSWFACTLEGLIDETPAPMDGEDQAAQEECSPVKDQKAEDRVWALKYDAREKFPETVHRCKFVDSASLEDLEFNCSLTWRKEGEAVDRAAMQAALSKMVVNMVQVLQDQTQMEEEEGENFEEQAAQELSKFPFYVQQAMAGIYRNFADSLKSSLRKRMEQLQAEGKENIITVQDISIIMAEVKASQPIQIPTYL